MSRSTLVVEPLDVIIEDHIPHMRFKYSLYTTIKVTFIVLLVPHIYRHVKNDNEDH